jgi:hypothetical protein
MEQKANAIEIASEKIEALDAVIDRLSKTQDIYSKS